MLLYCDDWQNDIPFRPTLKLAGTYPLKWGISVSAAFQSLAGRPLGLTTTTGNKISGPGYGDTGSPVGTNFLITAHHAVSGELPGAVPGRRAGGADADLGIGHRAARRARHRVPAADQSARSQLREDLPGERLSPAGTGRHLQRVQPELRDRVSIDATSRPPRTCSRRACCRAACSGSACR